jgi:hypothetical protein
MTLIYNGKKHEDQILVADSAMKFKIFDKNTFEILATYTGPIYDSYVQQFVSLLLISQRFFLEAIKMWGEKGFSFLYREIVVKLAK